jgi:hypothetical protein
MGKVGSVATSPSYTKMEWAADELERLSAELAEAKAEITALRQLADDLIGLVTIVHDGEGTPYEYIENAARDVRPLISRAKALRGAE